MRVQKSPLRWLKNAKMTVLHQRSGLVLCRHHDGHTSHAGYVGGGYHRGRQGWWAWNLVLGIGLGYRLSLRERGGTLCSRQRAAIGARCCGVARLAAWQGAAVVVTVVWHVGGGRRAMTGTIASGAARGGDDGGSVGGRALGVLLELWVVIVVRVLVVVVVRGLPLVWT